MFDAGAISASLTVDTAKADADLRKIEDRVRKLEDSRHVVRISAVFDSASIATARKAFANLDNLISRDAMQRLRSSPQGSILGSLNALFSPHPVTGGPSPQQAAAKGLLGQMISPQATAGMVTRPGGQQGSSQQGANLLRTVVSGQQPGNVTTTDTIKREVTGTAPGNIETTDTIREKIDPASKADVIKDSADSGDKSGQSFSASFTKHIRDMFDSIAKMGGSGGSSGGGSSGGGFASSLLGGIGPGILGLSAKVTGIVGAVGSALATLPALAGVAGLGVGTALIGGAVAAVIKTSPQLKAQFKTIGTDAESMLKQAAAPLIPALSAAFGQIPGMLKAIEPQLAGVFKTIAPQIGGVVAGLGPVIKGLLGIMQAAAPAFGPVIEGLEKLAANILPGIETVIKATLPFVSQFAGILATLGSHIGQLFSAAAPAIGASMKVLSAFLDLIGGLLPVIVKLGGVFATALAPVFVQFAAAVKALTPFLTTVGTVLAGLARAVLGDLVSAFGALAALLKAIAPTLNVFAKALGQVFVTLENSGAFAVLGDALEALVPPLANLINALLPAFVKFLPLMLRVATDLINAGIVVLVRVLGDLANIVTWLVTKMPFLVPLVIGIVTAVKLWAAAQALLDIALNANPIALIITALAALSVAIYELVTHWTTVWGAIKSVASDVGGFLDNLFHNGIVQDILDVYTLGLLPLVQHWSTVWGAITGALDTAWAHIVSAVFDPMETFFTVTIPGWWDTLTGFLSSKLVQPLESGLMAAWNWLVSNIGAPIDTFFTVTIPGYWDTFIGFLSSKLVTPFENGLIAAWNWVVANVGAPIDTFFTSTVPGYFDTFIGLVNSKFVQPFQNAMKGAWDWVVSNVWDPVKTMVTTTIPGWFDTAVSAIGTAWTKIEAAMTTPVNFVINDVLNPLIGAFDTITKALGLGSPIPKLSPLGGGGGGGQNAGAAGGGGTANISGRAQHGMKIPGYGGGDRHLILAEAGELILPKEAASDPMAAMLASKYGVPGYQLGGIIGGILGTIGKAALTSLEQLIPGLKVGEALTGAAVAGALGKFAAMGTGGAKGVLGDIITAIPKMIVKDMETWLAGHAKPPAAAGGGGGTGYTTTGAGDQTLAQLEALWIAAGGSPSVAYNMARIAIAESGGNPNAQNPSGATGLWQILGAVVAGNLFDPAVNAHNAVVKFSASGYYPWISDPVAAALIAGGNTGMANGGLINEPITGVGVSGRTYKFGERGPEWVVPASGGSGMPRAAMSGDKMDALIARIDQLIAVTGSLPHGITGGMGQALAGAAQSASFRTRYPRGGA